MNERQDPGIVCGRISAFEKTDGSWVLSSLHNFGDTMFFRKSSPDAKCVFERDTHTQKKEQNASGALDVLCVRKK